MLIAFVGAALSQPPKPEQPKADQKDEKADIHKLLASRVTTEKYEGKFKDAVQMLAEKYKLPLVLTKRAADWPVNDDEGTRASDAPIKLTSLKNVKVESVLGMVCDQAHLKFLVYPDHIKIVPDNFADYESGLLQVNTDPNTDDVPVLSIQDLIRTKPLTKRALVNANFKNKPLAEIVDEIAESTGANVVVSPLLPAQMRQMAITVRFANTPVDAAIRTLCEMTECGVIEDANVLLVTTRERAAARAKEDAQKLKDKQPPPAAVGGFASPLDVSPDTVIAVEIGKLREQNEQLRKQLEELQKSLKK